MKTLQLPDGTEKQILEDSDLPDEIPEMQLIELQAAYMGMLTALVSTFGPEFAVQMQTFAHQYLDQMIDPRTPEADDEEEEADDAS